MKWSVTGPAPRPFALRTLLNQRVSPAGTAVPLKFDWIAVQPAEAASSPKLYPVPSPFSTMPATEPSDAAPPSVPAVAWPLR